MKIAERIKNLFRKEGNVSDGYHTFEELYDYRREYNAAFFNMLHYTGMCEVHKSKRHHDGNLCFGGGWFIVIAELPTGQISNHYPIGAWGQFDVPVKERADEWDGHSPQEAYFRLHQFNKRFKIDQDWSRYKE